MTVGDDNDVKPVTVKMTGDTGDTGDTAPVSAADTTATSAATPAPPGPSPLASQTDEELLENFPVAKLTKLDELISNPR